MDDTLRVSSLWGLERLGPALQTPSRVSAGAIRKRPLALLFYRPNQQIKHIDWGLCYSPGDALRVLLQELIDDRLAFLVRLYVLLLRTELSFGASFSVKSRSTYGGDLL